MVAYVITEVEILNEDEARRYAELAQLRRRGAPTIASAPQPGAE